MHDSSDAFSAEFGIFFNHPKWPSKQVGFVSHRRNFNIACFNLPFVLGLHQSKIVFLNLDLRGYFTSRSADLAKLVMASWSLPQVPNIQKPLYSESMSQRNPVFGIVIEQVSLSKRRELGQHKRGDSFRTWSSGHDDAIIWHCMQAFHYQSQGIYEYVYIYKIAWNSDLVITVTFLP